MPFERVCGSDGIRLHLEQGSYVGGNGFRLAAVRRENRYLPVFINQISAGRVVDQIVFAIVFLIDFGRNHAVLLFDNRQALIAGRSQSDEVGVELFGVFADDFRRIPFGVDADEHDFHIFSLIAKLF